MSLTKNFVAQDTEMSREDHDLLLRALEEKQPRKILEVGVAAGGTTRLLLENMREDAQLFSVDVAHEYYRDKSKPVGYLAEQKHGDDTRWLRHYGFDISQCIDTIGADLDFVVLDTTHSLPGEVLSFLCILPYMKERSAIFIHDITLHSLGKMEGALRNSYVACALLFNALFSRNKALSAARYPNSGVADIDKGYALANIYPVVDTLFMDWTYVPARQVLTRTLAVAGRHYPEEITRFLLKAVEYNLARAGLTLTKGEDGGYGRL